ncbi:hypothetical protein CPB85DRAFT_170490 [Mucidula mucida]|nr:hypothetical protein CPB85DRAFT_170490 [Mucidula mucida]
MHMRLKQPVDVADIEDLFAAKKVGPSVGGAAWIPESFLSEGRRRVRAFVKARERRGRKLYFENVSNVYVVLSLTEFNESFQTISHRVPSVPRSTSPRQSL